MVGVSAIRTSNESEWNASLCQYVLGPYSLSTPCAVATVLRPKLSHNLLSELLPESISSQSPADRHVDRYFGARDRLPGVPTEHFLSFLEHVWLY